MLTYAEMKSRMLENPTVRAEYERIEREEMPMLDAILAARKEAGLTQVRWLNAWVPKRLPLPVWKTP